MERLRKYIAIQIAFAILVFTVCTCYMSVPVKAIIIDDAYQALGDLLEVIGADREVTPEIVRRAFYECITHDMGFITRDMTIQEAEWLRKGWAKILNNLYGSTDKTKDNLTSDDYERLAQYITQNVTLNEGNRSVTYNNNAKSALNICINERINEAGMTYVYSMDLLNHINLFSDAQEFAALRRLISENQDSYRCFYGYGAGSGGGWRLALYPNTAKVVGVYSQNIYTDINKVDIYNLDTWNYQPITRHYKYNSETHEYEIFTGSISASTGLVAVKQGVQAQNIKQTYYGGRFFYVTVNQTAAMKCYSDIDTMKSGTQGLQPYYFNNVVYNNQKNSTGDYIVNSDNSNHATYSQVTTYINNTTEDTGNPPNSDTINIYIENVPAPTPEPEPTPTSSPDNPSGGGTGSSVSGNSGGNASATATAQGGQGGHASANNEGINITINNNHNINLGGGSGLSGNTVSGNGSGSSGGIGGIFDFLSQIGDFIGSLIKNIGNVLADIVTGIGSVVSSLLEVIPTVFNDFLGGVLGWLPPELRALVTLSISAMIIVGLIKLFRG